MAGLPSRIGGAHRCSLKRKTPAGKAGAAELHMIIRNSNNQENARCEAALTPYEYIYFTR